MNNSLRKRFFFIYLPLPDFCGKKKESITYFIVAYELKTAVKEVIGTCVSMGVSVDGKKPKEVLALIAQGKYDSVLVK